MVTNWLAEGTVHAKAARRMEAEGIEVVDPVRRWPDWWRHELLDEGDIARARQAGTLVAWIHDDGTVAYYTTAAAGARGIRWARHRQEREQAAQARAHACARIAQAGPPSMPTGPDLAIADTLAQALLHGAPADAAHLAHAWLHPHLTDTRGAHSQGGDLGDIGDLGGAHYDWRSQLLAAGDAPAAQQARISAAYAVALAQEEDAARWSYSSRIHSNWGARQVAHLERLQAAGYEPTGWERQHLEAARTKIGRDRHDAGQAVEGHGPVDHSAPTVGLSDHVPDPGQAVTLGADLDDQLDGSCDRGHGQRPRVFAGGRQRRRDRPKSEQIADRSPVGHGATSSYWPSTSRGRGGSIGRTAASTARTAASSAGT